MDEEFFPSDISFKKRRLQGACDECKKRKSRISLGITAIYDGLITYNFAKAIARLCPATYAVTAWRSGPSVHMSGQWQGSTPRGQKTVPSLVKSILSPTKPYIIPENPEQIRQVLTSLAYRIVTLEEQLAERDRDGDFPGSIGQRSPSMMCAYYTPATLTQDGDDDESDTGLAAVLDEDVKKHVKIEHAQMRHFGQSSIVSFVRSALDAQVDKDALGTGSEPGQSKAAAIPQPMSRRPEFWNVHPWQIPIEEPPPHYIFPEEDLLHNLIDLYFTNISPFFPILHRGIFEKCVSQNLHHRDRDFAAVVLVVCATASRTSEDPRVLDDRDEHGRLSAGWKWFRQIRLIKNKFIEPPSVYELQLYCITVYFLSGTSTPEASWVVLGLGVRLAQDMGIHRKPPSDAKPTIESQLWNRAFWVLIAIDVVMSTFLGRPRATHTDDFDLPLPIECDDEYWETEDPEMAFKQPPGKPCTMSYWVSFLKLLDIVGFSQRTIYAVRKTDMWTRMGMSGPEWTEKIVAELDSALNAWVDTIPGHLKWNPTHPSQTHFLQSTILYMTYYWVQLLVHKSFLNPHPNAKVGFPSMTICANAARLAIHLAEVFQKQGRGGAVWMFPTVMHAVYSSGIVLYVNTGKGKKAGNGNSEAVADVQKCIQILSKYEKISQVAGRFCDILNDLFSVSASISESTNDSSLPASLSRSRKRPDSRRRAEEEDEEGRRNREGEGEEREEEGERRPPSAGSSAGPRAAWRPMASSKRATSGFTSSGTPHFDPAHSPSRPFSSQSQSQFALPISTAELGVGSLNLPFPYPNQYDQQHQQYSYEAAQFDQIAAGLGVGGGGGGGGGVEGQTNYRSRFMADALATAFGDAGHEGEGFPSAHSNPGAGTSAGAWNDWSFLMDS
ncbi:Gypsy retrotransposon integrase-like protein 1 [Marasmius crinis-equi]|uniref:Gypsy retrotransposon integrase-like protein 1 n=1 Tax=Marasmius crinis-equi TaxID=585013 RepID=A0ABR3ETK1_9AGAR